MSTLLRQLKLEPISWIMRKRRMGFLMKTVDLPPTNLYRRLLFCQATTTGKRGSPMSTAKSYAEDLKKYGIFVTSKENWDLASWIGQRDKLECTAAFDWSTIEEELL